MPRNGSGVYSLPAGSTFSPNTLIQSSVVNGINTDLATDLNTPRPIVAGGTGATTALAARLALGVVTAVYAAKSGNYTAVLSDIGAVHRYTATATVALTAAATLGLSWYYTVVADGAAVTIDPNGSETINGLLTLTIPNGATATIICDGSNFFTVIRTSAWVPIGAPIVLSGQTVVDWTDLGSYSHLRLTIYTTPSATASLFTRVSTDNGATFISTVSYYYSVLAQQGASVVGTANASVDSILMTASNAVTAPVMITADISYFNKNTGCIFKTDTFRTATLAPIIARDLMYGAHTGTTARNALRLGITAGNFASGQVILEGIRG